LTLPDFDLAPTPAELQRFAALQARFAAQYHDIFGHPLVPRTIVVVPSLGFDPDMIAKVKGAHHYEERMLCLLLLLRLPRTQLIYLTSTTIPATIIDYYLHLLPGVPGHHARQRLTFLSADDASAVPLTAKFLARPRLMARLKAAIRHPEAVHLSCFTVTEQERRLALALEAPIYGCDPSLLHWGSKSGSRQIFREAGVPLPEGHEGLKGRDDMVRALVDLRQRKPALRKAVVKLEEGFSGDGNATFRFEGAPDDAGLGRWVEDSLPTLAPEADGMGFEAFVHKFGTMGGIVEEWLDGADKVSPSAQVRVDPTGRTSPISTHDQILGGQTGQVYLGCRFPADPGYAAAIQALGLAAGEALAQKGVTGRFGVDFLSVRTPSGWDHRAIEVNLRKGGTTHPFLTLQFLTDGRYDSETATYRTAQGQPACYTATDNLVSDAYRGLTPHDLIDIAVMNGLHWNAAASHGVAFHLLGATSECGKLGATCIAPTHAAADALLDRTRAVLDRECAP
jgi:hypothetical protein